MTRGSSFACGTFLPSMDNAQNPEMSRAPAVEDAVPGTARAGGGVCAPTVALMRTSVVAMRTRPRVMVIDVAPLTSELFGSAATRP